MFDSFATLMDCSSPAPLSMGFPSQEYWSELPLPPPGDLPNPGIKPPDYPALTGGSFTTGSLGTPGRETYFLPNPRLYSWNVLFVPNSFKIMLYRTSSPLGSSVHGILQARILEWVAISFSKGSSQPRDRTCVSRIACRFFTI